jgi:hypothetical protein
MGEPSPLQSFAEDLEVLRQLTMPEERVEFTDLMKRAYAQHLSACAFVRQSPERRVSARIRRLCSEGLSRPSTTAMDDSQDTLGGASDEGTDAGLQNAP